MTYAWEKFHMALHTLAGLGTIQERLVDAYSIHLMHVDPEELPEEVRTVFGRLRADLTGATPQADEGPVEAAVAAMSDEQALEQVERILLIHDAVARREGGFQGVSVGVGKPRQLPSLPEAADLGAGNQGLSAGGPGRLIHKAPHAVNSSTPASPAVAAIDREVNK